MVGFKPVIGQFEEFVDRAAAVVASNGFVQVPPDSFDGIGFRRVFGQEVQLNPLSPALRDTPVPGGNCETARCRRSHGSCGSHASDAASRPDERQTIRVAAFGRRAHQQRSGAPHQRACQMPLDVVAGSFDGRLLALEHPAGTDLGIQVQIDFILEHRHLVRRQAVQQSANLPEFRGVVRIGRSDHRPRPAPGEAQVVQAPTDGFSADAGSRAASRSSSANNSQVQRLRK